MLHLANQGVNSLRRFVSDLAAPSGGHPGLPGSSLRALEDLYGPLRRVLFAAIFANGGSAMTKEYEGDYEYEEASKFDKAFRIHLSLLLTPNWRR